MNKITKKVCALILSTAFFISAIFSFSACKNNKKGKDGVDGQTPFIGENGHWWIGEVDTGVVAQGQNGKDGVNGKDGADGKDGVNGKDGANGQDGKNGIDGKDGKNGADALAPQFRYDAESGNLEVSYNSGESWSMLVNIGDMVSDGKDGEDGVSIISCEINAGGELIIDYSNGDSDNLGVVVAKDGEDGIGVLDAEIDDDGNLTITLSDGTELPLGKVKGENGSNGLNGDNGIDGCTPRLKIDTDTHEWCVSYDDGESWASLGVVAIGTNGTNGTNGINGIDGNDGVTPQVRINAANSMWEVSYDNGMTWASLGSTSVGEPGADGVTPLLRINNGYWEVSYDKGKIWKTLGVKAEGSDGKPGEDGEDGDDGDDGRGIAKMEIIDGYLYVTYTDSAVPVKIGQVSSEAVGSGTVVNDVYTDALAFYPNSDKTSYSVAIGNAIYMETIVIPSTYNGLPVTKILPNSFTCNGETNSTLKSITIPDSIVEIGASAFSSCENLEEINIPASVTVIGSQAFASNTIVRFEITEDEIPSGQTWTKEKLGCREIYWKE